MTLDQALAALHRALAEHPPCAHAPKVPAPSAHQLLDALAWLVSESAPEIAAALHEFVYATVAPMLEDEPPFGEQELLQVALARGVARAGLFAELDPDDAV